ncbi:hypothetical protein EW026_g7744 [Hermanssonia centrifuga]|uniref:HTH CENPB-type domain-containing protein n=1 Tax=Hermanssonia centrifuga TaxID=98765 RepID=A0A4S4K8J9_9APHY|nr:hypothetical protein EW026_g7744 [Hermanssonia centrifuga]
MRPKALRHDKIRQWGREESAIEEACVWLRKEKTETMQAAAVKFEVSYWKLRSRYLKLHAPPHVAQKRRLLTSVQEDVLVAWMRLWSAQGTPVSRQSLRVKVKNYTGQKPSLRWIDNFKNRHPELVLRRPSPLDLKRAACFNRTAVSRHFKEFAAMIQSHGPFKTMHIYNVDEKGAQLGGGRKTTGVKYFHCRHNREKYRKRSANLELVTVIECVSADGAVLTPGFIFSGGWYDMAWFEGCSDSEHISVGKTENGWTDDFQCLKWFTESFIPQARARAGDDNEPILLVVDGHGSHVTKEMAKAGLAHNVHIFCLPPHTTHRLQPLDVGCFGLLSRKWLERCEEVIEATRENIAKGDFVREYMSVRAETMTKKVIVAAWQKTGLSPFNPDIFTEIDFAPSNATSTKAHVPLSFPQPMELDYDSEAEPTGDDHNNGDEEENGIGDALATDVLPPAPEIPLPPMYLSPNAPHPDPGLVAIDRRWTKDKQIEALSRNEEIL